MTITPDMTMGELVSTFPGAQRALFRAYHIGGCSSCGFQPSETLAQVCERNGNIAVGDVITTLSTARDADEKMQVTVKEADELVKAGKAKLIDVRSREEWDAVHIEGSDFLTQELMHELGSWPKDQLIVFYCHHGVRSLDAAAYFAGHGLDNVRSMKGGIDAWSCEVDANLPRYDLA